MLCFRDFQQGYGGCQHSRKPKGPSTPETNWANQLVLKCMAIRPLNSRWIPIRLRCGYPLNATNLTQAFWKIAASVTSMPKVSIENVLSSRLSALTECWTNVERLKAGICCDGSWSWVSWIGAEVSWWNLSSVLHPETHQNKPVIQIIQTGCQENTPNCTIRNFFFFFFRLPNQAWGLKGSRPRNFLFFFFSSEFSVFTHRTNHIFPGCFLWQWNNFFWRPKKYGTPGTKWRVCFSQELIWKNCFTDLNHGLTVFTQWILSFAWLGWCKQVEEPTKILTWLEENKRRASKQRSVLTGCPSFGSCTIECLDGATLICFPQILILSKWFKAEKKKNCY